MASSSASPDHGNGNILIFHRLTGMDERIGRVEESIVLGILGAIGSGASFLFIRLLTG